MTAGLAVGLWAGVAGLVTMPLWYWALSDSEFVIDTLPRAFAATAGGLLLIPVCGVLVRWITAGEIAAMRFVLRPRGEVASTPVRAAVGARASGRRSSCTSRSRCSPGSSSRSSGSRPGWATSGRSGSGSGSPSRCRLHGVAVRAWAARRDQDRSFRVKVEVCALIAGYQWIIWALAGFGYVWPIWPMLGMGTVLALRALFLYGDRLPWMDRKELVERVDVLTRTRQGALDVQAAELRRIERDLHDGAQARLVALSMRLGRAEERLADQPEIAALVREAREDAGAAIGELRDLARGIAPPILADRGLTAAIEALARRSAIGVTIDADPDRRPLPVVETAAYFVVAEALTNVAKHAGGAAAHVRVTLEGDDVLVLEIADEGPGGADPGGQRVDRAAQPRRGAGRAAVGRQPRRRGNHRAGGAAMRAVIVEDLALLREGIVALLRENGIEVVAQAEDGPGLLRIVAGHKPDVAIVDVRLPPTFTDEGLRAAIEARERHPGLGVLVVSQYVEPVYTAELLASGEAGVGYLLKERVGEVRAFIDAVRARGGGRDGAGPRGRGGAHARADGGRGVGHGARRADAARARGAGAHGRGPLERGGGAGAGGQRRRGREARAQHLRQARSARQQRRPPAGAGRAGVPAGGSGLSAAKAGERRSRDRARCTASSPRCARRSSSGRARWASWAGCATTTTG